MWDASLKKHNKKMEKEIVSLGQEKVGPKKKTGKCFRCGKQGHFTQDCRVKIPFTEACIANSVKNE